MIRCTRYAAVTRGTVVAIVTLEIGGAGVTIHECELHAESGKQWVTLPQRAYQDRSGARKSVPLIEFSSSAARQTFQAQAIAACRDHRDR